MGDEQRFPPSSLPLAGDGGGGSDDGRGTLLSGDECYAFDQNLC